MACTWLSTQELWSFGFLKPSSKIKRTMGHCKGFKSHVSWLFLLVHLALNGDILPALLLEEYCFSPIWSIQELEWLEILPVRLPALIPFLAPVCAAPPPSWACRILKASLRFWARSSLLWISSTTRLGNQPLSPSWSLSPIIQPSFVLSRRFKTSAISMESSSGSWNEYDWMHCTWGESGWWALVDIKRVRRLGVRVHIHRSLSLMLAVFSM